MVDGIVEVIRKPEFLEVSHTDFYNHISLINNIVSEDKLEILAEFDNSSSTEANDSEIERLIDEKSGETTTANTEKKITLLSRNTRNKACYCRRVVPKNSSKHSCIYVLNNMT